MFKNLASAITATMFFLLFIAALPWNCQKPTPAKHSFFAETSGIRFGLWVSGVYHQDPEFKNACLDSVKIKTTLVEICSSDSAKNKYYPINYYIRNSKFVQLNYLYNRKQGKVSFAATKKERQAYQDSLDVMLQLYQPVYVCVEREEANPNYYFGPVTWYKKELKKAQETGKKYGVQVSNGGITTRDLTIMVYRDLQDNDSSKCKSWADRCLPGSLAQQLNSRRNVALEEKIKRLDSLFDAYKKYCDVVNFHWYEPVKYRGETYFPEIENIDSATVGALDQAIAFLKKRTGKNAICNEMGQINSNPKLTESMVDAARNSKLLYCGWFSGDLGFGSATPFFTPSGFLTQTGKAFAQKSNF